MDKFKIPREENAMCVQIDLGAGYQLRGFRLTRNNETVQAYQCHSELESRLIYLLATFERHVSLSNIKAMLYGSQGRHDSTVVALIVKVRKKLEVATRGLVTIEFQYGSGYRLATRRKKNTLSSSRGQEQSLPRMVKLQSAVEYLKSVAEYYEVSVFERVGKSSFVCVAKPGQRKHCNQLPKQAARLMTMILNAPQVKFSVEELATTLGVQRALNKKEIVKYWVKMINRTIRNLNSQSREFTTLDLIDHTYFI